MGNRLGGDGANKSSGISKRFIRLMLSFFSFEKSPNTRCIVRGSLVVKLMCYVISRTFITETKKIAFDFLSSYDGACKILKQIGQICVCLSITENKLRCAQY